MSGFGHEAKDRYWRIGDVMLQQSLTHNSRWRCPV